MKRISIASYVEDAALVLRCGERLAHALGTDAIDEREQRRTLFALTALLGLVGERLMLLRRMVVGEADPAAAWTDRVSALPGVGSDIVLAAWKPETKRKAKP